MSSTLPPMLYCRCCTHPNTRPRIRFDEAGVCNGCRRSREKTEIDWAAREEEFRAVVHEAVSRSPNREYDVIIPVSGGKDSTFQAWYAVNKLQVRPLCVNVQPFLPTEVGGHNLRNLAERLPVDVLSLTPNQGVMTRLTRIAFERHGDPLVPFLFAMFGGISRIALQKKIPVILFGENGDREYGGSDEKEFVELDHKGVEARIRSDKVGFLPPSRWTEYGFTPAEVALYQDPTDEEMAEIGLTRLFFSDYTPWSNNHHLHIALNVVGGFEMSEGRAPGTFTFGYSTDDDLYDAYIWLLWPKFGFCRSTKYTSKDIQEGKIGRDEAIKLVRDYDGEFPWQAFERFRTRLGLSEEELWETIARFVGDEENLRREADYHGTPMKIPAWERIGKRKWRLRSTLHGEERILELPIPRPILNG